MRKSKILFVFYKPLNNTLGGDKLDVFNTIFYLSQHYDIDLVLSYPYFFETNPELVSLPKNVNLIININSKSQILKNILKNIFRLKPLQNALFSFSYNEYEDYEYIFYRSSRFDINPKSKKAKNIFLITDSLYITYKKVFQNISCINPMKIYYYLEYNLFKKHESMAIKNSKLSIFVNHLEAKKFKEEYPLYNIRTLHNGVDSIFFNNKIIKNLIQHDNIKIVVFGKHDARHNFERLKAIETICKTNYNRIFLFTIIGSLGSKENEIKQMFNPYENINIIGRYATEKDLIEVIKQHHFSFHYYETASGIQNTLLQSIALGINCIIDPKTYQTIANFITMDQKSKFVILDRIDEFNEKVEVSINVSPSKYQKFPMTWEQRTTKLIDMMREL